MDNNVSVRNDVVRKQRKTLTKKGKVYLETEESIDSTDLRIRSAPLSLYDAVKHIVSVPCLRQYVRALGFEKILKLNISLIPSNLAYKIVECYNVEEQTLVLKGHEIKITRDLVHDILGFPKGDLRINFAKRTSYKKIKLDLQSFWKQYYDADGKLIVKTKDRSFSTNLKDFILATNEVNDVFKLNFIILLVSTMISACKGGESNMKFLESLAQHYDSINRVDWCGLVVDSLALNKHDVKKNSRNDQYCGPITFLTVCFYF